MQKIERAREFDQDGLATETTRVTRTDSTAPERVNEPSVIAARVIWFIAGVIIALLAIRFILILLGASTASAFVNFIYILSYPFALPFFGIFGYTLQYGVSRVEISSIVAMIIYGLVAWGLVRLITIRQPQPLE